MASNLTGTRARSKRPAASHHFSIRSEPCLRCVECDAGRRAPSEPMTVRLALTLFGIGACAVGNAKSSRTFNQFARYPAELAAKSGQIQNGSLISQAWRNVVRALHPRHRVTSVVRFGARRRLSKPSAAAGYRSTRSAVYKLSIDEFLAWVRDIDHYGTGLRATRYQIYRQTDTRKAD